MTVKLKKLKLKHSFKNCLNHINQLKYLFQEEERILVLCPVKQEKSLPPARKNVRKYTLDRDNDY